MLRLPRFDVVVPETLESALEALATEGAMPVAGGTDLLPNLKHRLHAPRVLVSTARVRTLGAIEVDRAAGQLRLGASVTLAQLASHPDVQREAPSLAQAAGSVASPLIRNMGTLGGNLNLDTRCRYVNQTQFWRSAIGGCLKSEGDRCHVVPGGQSCVAALSSDCAPVLITLDASVVLRSARGSRTVRVEDYYGSNGVAHVQRRADELTCEVLVPLAERPRRATYTKWAVRKSIDFPLVSVAMRFDLDGAGDAARIVDARVCVGVLAAKPRVLRRTETLAGRRLDDPGTTAALGQLIFGQCKPLPNVPYDADYRRKMLPIYAGRALATLR
jgi:4-hydroxybenzoyl-CoA reductase subunit beta